MVKRYDKRDMERFAKVSPHVWSWHYCEGSSREPHRVCYYGRLDDDDKCQPHPNGWEWGNPPPPRERVTTQTETGTVILERVGGQLWREVTE